MLIDRFGRKHTSLRISVTDRCNLRCTYCMPAETPDYCEREGILTYEEIERIVRIAVHLGVDDVRLTGGEPLVRSQLHRLVAAINRIDGIRKISMTTNAILLQDQLPDLVAAGLKSINISLDALDEASFLQVTRRKGMQTVLDAVDACLRKGVQVKINAIAMRDFTEKQIVAFGEFTRRTGVPVRFIEFMPLDADGNWNPERVLAGQQILDMFSQQVRPLVAVVPESDRTSQANPTSAPAKDYQFDDGIGTIGIIASVTQPFCDTCNRFRLTADGQLRNCLFGGDSGDVRQALRGGASDETIAKQMRDPVAAKKRGHGTDDLAFQRPDRPMYSIGG